MYLGSDMPWRVLLAAILVAATAIVARAGATTPTLIVESAATAPAGTGAGRLVTFTVAYDHSNAIQADYDLELIVHQGVSFARFPVSGEARVGSSPALADGLAVADLPALDAAGAPAPASVRLVTLEPTRISVTLPATFSASTGATAVLVATVDEGIILSNPLGFVVP